MGSVSRLFPLSIIPLEGGEAQARREKDAALVLSATTRGDVMVPLRSYEEVHVVAVDGVPHLIISRTVAKALVREAEPRLIEQLENLERQLGADQEQRRSETRLANYQRSALERIREALPELSEALGEVLGSEE